MSVPAKLPVAREVDRRAVKAVCQRLPEAVRLQPAGRPAVVARADHLIDVLTLLRHQPDLQFDQLVDLTAVDLAGPHSENDLTVVYQLRSLRLGHQLQLETQVRAGAGLATATGVWPGANWPERELFEMFGVTFEGHPDLRRLLTPEWLGGFPLRRGYPLRGSEARLSHVGPPTDEPAMGETTRAGLDLGFLDPASPDLRIHVELDGETIVRTTVEPGYQHSGLEKLAEHRTYLQLVPLTERLSQAAPFAAGLAYVLAVEEVLAIEVPSRGQHFRLILGELTRLCGHLSWLARQAWAAGYAVVRQLAIAQREALAQLLGALTGDRAGVGVLRIGGMGLDLPGEFAGLLPPAMASLHQACTQIDSLFMKDRSWVRRSRGSGAMEREDAIAWGLTGPALRAAGVAEDVRRSAPYLSYTDYDFDIPVGACGDVYDRCAVRLQEMEQSARILKRAAEVIPRGPVRVADYGITQPPHDEVGAQMEPLIHHFQRWMEGHGLRPPAGTQVYRPTEAHTGELGFYLVSDGTDRPRRLHLRPPSLYHAQILTFLLPGTRLGDAAALVASLDVVAGEMDR